jgi:WD40 repeat protein
VGDSLRSGGQFWYTPVFLWNTDSGSVARTFRGHVRWKNTLYETMGAIRRENGGLVTNSNDLYPDRFPTASIHCVAISPDGRKGISGANDGTVRVWGLA